MERIWGEDEERKEWMRTVDEMMELILSKAKEDERIRAATMEGSRANPNAVHDEYSDFDICYFVKDIREFTCDETWIDYFGERLILQCPCDWHDEPYDYNGRERYTYLMQFTDGNRIDLTLIDITKIKNELENDEPRLILLDKDGYEELQPITNEKAFETEIPTEREYKDICNEFRWVSLYVTKGMYRNEFYYARYHYESITEEFLKMLDLKIAVDHNFKSVTGKHYKYLKRYLSQEEMIRVQKVFPSGEYDEMWEKLFDLYDYFEEVAEAFGKKMNYAYDAEEGKRVREFIRVRYEKYRKR